MTGGKTRSAWTRARPRAPAAPRTRESKLSASAWRARAPGAGPRDPPSARRPAAGRTSSRPHLIPKRPWRSHITCAPLMTQRCLLCFIVPLCGATAAGLEEGFEAVGGIDRRFVLLRQHAMFSGSRFASSRFSSIRNHEGVRSNGRIQQAQDVDDGRCSGGRRGVRGGFAGPRPASVDVVTQRVGGGHGRGR